MKALVTINSRGVVTLPAKLREELGIQPDDQLIAETTPEGLLLRPAVTLPIEIYNAEREREFDEGEAELAATLARPPKASVLRAREPAPGRKRGSKPRR
jgi:AbrB family looped-hinge helix DNA binding protein